MSAVLTAVIVAAPVVVAVLVVVALGRAARRGDEVSARAAALRRSDDHCD